MEITAIIGVIVFVIGFFAYLGGFSIISLFSNKKKPRDLTAKPKFYEGWTFLIIFCVLLPIAFRTFVYSPFHIPSGSMKPTLLVGDYIFVSKFSYGFSRYSLPFGVNLIPERIWKTEPKRGDIVVFKKPTDTSLDYIKRLIGLPGDEIQMKNGVLFINGQEVKKECGEEFIDDEYKERPKTLIQCTETLPEGLQHKTLDESAFGPVDNTDVYKVPPRHYFFMGDNRDNSQDSRYLSEVGYVPEENLVGRADLIFFSARSSLLAFWEWPHLLRTERFFKEAK